MKISASLEDYLETILMIDEKNNGVKPKNIAEKLGVKRPSVTDALNLLKKRKLIKHENYGLVFLTQKGMELAKNVLNKHFLIKEFLMVSLNVHEDVAEQDACRIEHVLSNATFLKIKKFIDARKD